MSFPTPELRRRLSELDAVIAAALPTGSSTITAVAQHLIGSGGKRLRPLVAMHYAQALGELDERQLTYAAVIELIHAATLLHDDIVDDAQLRRGKLTANHNWSNAASVLSGDYLYARALQSAVELGDLRALSLLTRTVQSIAHGEVEQLEAKGNSLSIAGYLQIIERKSAILFACACAGSALFASASEEQIQAAYEFGRNYGLAFQIIDDLLDYSHLEQQTGKSIGRDYCEGKYTLPLIYTLERCDAGQRRLLLANFGKGDQPLEANWRALLDLMSTSGALAASKGLARGYLERAGEQLELSLPASPERAALSSLLDSSLSRTS